MQLFPDLVLKTDRLTLRALREPDAADVVTGASDAITQRWLPLPRPYTMEHALTFITKLAPGMQATGHGLVRALESDGAFVGVIDLKRTDWVARVTEIGYWAMPGLRGRGLITEATAALARWAIEEFSFERVELRIAPENEGSIRVAEKAGFVREGVARSAGFIHDGRVDLAIYSRIRSDR